MSLSLNDVKNIAHLARIELSSDEADATLAQLNSIFSVIEAMKAVDTEALLPLSTPLAAIGEVQLRLREDRVTEEDHRADYLKNAAASEDGLFLVPKVIE